MTKSKKKTNFSFFFTCLAILLVFLGGAFIFLGSLRSFPYAWSQIFKPSPSPDLSINAVPIVKPIKLYIPKLSKILPISDGTFTSGRWIIAQSGVSFLTSSAIPGQAGNSVIYGHNLPEILGNLPNLKVGDFVYVVLSSGDFVKYQIFEAKEISPNQVEILNDMGDRRLTIYTCSGFLDQARFVVVGRLVGW